MFLFFKTDTVSYYTIACKKEIGFQMNAALV